MNVHSPVPAVIRSLEPTPPRAYAGINWIGLQTLYMREVRRFWKIALQTVLAPVVTTLLYMLVFVVAMKGARPAVNGVSFSEFVGPGLIMMTMLNNAFANSSSSLLQAKIMGTAADFLTPPLSPLEMVLGFTGGAATRGLAVGLVTSICVWPFAHLHVAELWAVVFYGVGASVVMALVGVVAGLWSEKFDHMAAVTNLVIMPMTFLSGTFYRATALPGPARAISAFNPFFYLIDGFRYGFIGRNDGSLVVGVSLTCALMVGLAVLCWALFRSGWRLKT